MPNHTPRRHALTALVLTGLASVIAAGQTPVPDINAYMANVQIEPPNGEVSFGNALSELGDITNTPDGFSDVLISASASSKAWIFFGPLGTRDPSGAFSYFGSSPGSQLGNSIDGSGDFDGDGVNDIMIGELYYNAGFFINEGRVLIYSGRNGVLLSEWFGNGPNALLGRRVRYFADVAGQIGDEVFVLSNLTGIPQTDLRTYRNISLLPETLFTFDGEIVSNAGQVDGDSFGVPDIAIGFPFDNANGILSGTVTYRKGNTGAAIVPHFGPSGQPGQQLGSEIVSMGDLNGDGIGDVLASGVTQFNNPAGPVRVISGAIPFHDTIIEFISPDIGDRFGKSIANIGDIDGDSVSDIAIGAPASSPFISGVQVNRAGRVYIYSGATGNLLMTFTGSEPGDFFGSAISSAGDFNGDGMPDLMVSAPSSTAPLTGSGMVYIFFLPRLHPADLNNDLVVNSADLAAMLANWGNCDSPTLAPCMSDLNSDGVVNSTDIARLLTSWGSCL